MSRETRTQLDDISRAIVEQLHARNSTTSPGP